MTDADTTGLAPGLVTTQWARVLIDGLATAGVQHVLVSPGSRNTPLVAAALSDSRLACAWVIDERSASFVALGIARATDRPVVLVCTSGTAGAHYLPAVLEAKYGRSPLLVLTADRPPELQRCGSNQTVDQRVLFGGIPAWDLGVPHPSDRALRAVRQAAGHAVFATCPPEAGPVHINAPFRKPLAPVEPVSTADIAFVGRVDALLSSPLAQPGSTDPRPDSDAIDRISRRMVAAQRGIVVAGPAPVCARSARDLVAQAAARTGFPVYAEATSQLRAAGLGAYLCLRAEDAVAYAPDFVLQVGASPVATAWLRYIDQNEVPRAILADARHPAGGWSDPAASAQEVVFGVEESLRALIDALPDTRLQPPSIGASPTPSFDEAGAARAAVEAMPAGGGLLIGNSLAVRVLDEGAAALPADVWVVSQRGVSGIDGLLAGAVGMAVAQPAPVLLILGDVTFAHDLGSLQLRRLVEDRILTVVVLDNDGGRIFDRLPLAGTPLPERDRDFWRTPPGVDVEAVAEAHGWRTGVFTSSSSLTAAVAESMTQPGGTILRAVVS